MAPAGSPVRFPGLGWIGAGVAVAIAYPFVVERALGRFGVGPVATALFVVGLATAFASIRRFGVRPGAIASQALVLGLLAAAAASGQRAFLLALPVVVFASLAWVFASSLRDEVPIVERGARLMQPHVPTFIRRYCRIVTAMWALFFAGAAIRVAFLTDDVEAWRAFTGFRLYLAAGVVQGLEAIFRKAWFRAFEDTPLDRAFRRLFPPEKTERGRRSLAFIRDKRIELGMDPRPDEVSGVRGANDAGGS